MTISRDDLEGKLREIEAVVVETEEEAKQKVGLVIGGAVVVVVALIAYGIWRSRRRRIHIEVYQTT
jgi:FtsZ-interacting cell division protein ZipA